MKLNCPKCNSEITSNSINIKEGIAQCVSCNEVFKIANYITSSEELRRLPRPINTGVTIEVSIFGSEIKLPPNGLNGSTIFFLIFAIFWNTFLIFFIPNFFKGSNFNGLIGLFFIPFIVVGLFMIGVFLFNYKGFTIISLNKENITVTWQLFSLKYSRKRNSSDLQKITEDVVYSKNYQPVYGIRLYFRNNSKIKFGSNLKEEERKWLIGELYELKNKYKI